MDERLTRHFKLSEFTCTSHTELLSLNRQAFNSNSLFARRAQVIALFLEYFRTFLGDKPLRITSGFRCPELNTAVHGATHSDHLSMLAVDLALDYNSGCSLAGFISDDLYIGSCTRYIEVHPTYIHISFDDFRLPLDLGNKPQIRYFKK